MKLYITFGQVHAHAVNGKTFDKDCVAEIECTTQQEGRKLAFEAFGDKFAFSYLKLPDMKYFPRGVYEL